MNNIVLLEFNRYIWNIPLNRILLILINSTKIPTHISLQIKIYVREKVSINPLKLQGQTLLTWEIQMKRLIMYIICSSVFRLRTFRKIMVQSNWKWDGLLEKLRGVAVNCHHICDSPCIFFYNTVVMEFSWWYNSASLNSLFIYQPSISRHYLKCWKGHKTPSHYHYLWNTRWLTIG